MPKTKNLASDAPHGKILDEHRRQLRDWEAELNVAPNLPKTNCGVKVREAASSEIQPLVVDVRRRVEVFALRSAFDQLASRNLPRLENALGRLKVACEGGGVPAVVEHDMALHRIIVEAPGDDDLIAIWLPVVVRMMLHYSRHRDLMASYREHAAIVDAIRSRDKRAAAKALKENIQ